MKGWRDDPACQQLSQELSEAQGDADKLAALLEQQAALRRPVPFREFVNCALAVHIQGKDITYWQLTRAIGEKIGTNHEDESYGEDLARLRPILIAGLESYLPPLIHFADLVIKVGSMFIGYLVQHYDYETKYFSGSLAKYSGYNTLQD
jgi:hypothetical protein